MRAVNTTRPGRVWSKSRAQEWRRGSQRSNSANGSALRIPFRVGCGNSGWLWAHSIFLREIRASLWSALFGPVFSLIRYSRDSALTFSSFQRYIRTRHSFHGSTLSLLVYEITTHARRPRQSYVSIHLFSPTHHEGLLEPTRLRLLVGRSLDGKLA